VGKDAAETTTRRLRKEAELNAVNHGLAVSPEDEQNGHRSIAAAAADFLEETKLTEKPETLAAYSTAVGYFQESCPKLYLDDIERGDLLKFSAFLRDQKNQSPRSAYNKFENLMTDGGPAKGVPADPKCESARLMVRFQAGPRAIHSRASRSGSAGERRSRAPNRPAPMPGLAHCRCAPLPLALPPRGEALQIKPRRG